MEDVSLCVLPVVGVLGWEKVAHSPSSCAPESSMAWIGGEGGDNEVWGSWLDIMTSNTVDNASF